MIMCTRTFASALAMLVALAGASQVARPVRADTRPGFYLGVGGGSGHLELGDEQLSVEANDIGYQVFAGCNFRRYFALAAAWFDAGVLTNRSERRALLHARRQQSLPLLRSAPARL
jgi:hypothetical protein